jgi:hypothetical protein
MSEEKSLLEKLAASRPARVANRLKQKVYVPLSTRKVPRGDYESTFTKKWQWNHTERKKRRKIAKESRRKNRRG